MIETIRTFTALSEEFVELFMKHHPVAATEAGIHDYDALLPDDSPDGLRARAAWLRDLEGRLLASVPWDELPLDARVDFALLRSRISTLRADLEEIRVPHRTPTVFLMRAFRGVHLLLARPFAPLDERKESAVARLMAIPEYFEGACANLTAVPPELLEAGLALAARGPGFVDDVVRRLLRQFPGESERLEHAGSRARTGFLRLHEHLEALGRTGAGASGSFALTERWVNHRYEHEHLFSITAAEVEVLAREHVQEARQRLVEEARRTDARRDWRELVDEGRRRLPEANWLRETYTAEIERARRFVQERRLAPLPDGERLEIQDTPTYASALAPQACYVGPAPFDAEAPGIFQLTSIDPRRDKDAQARQLEGHCLPMIPLVAVRETYPGLHALHARAARAGTRLRRMARNESMSGGWAAYAEELMAAQGFLDAEPYALVFARLSELRRACLALVDVAMHAGRLTVPQAVVMLAEDALLSHDAAVSAVRECCLAPTRASSALVGCMAIGDLRDESARQLGAKFDLGGFHVALAEGGMLPPALVREELPSRLGVG